MMAVSASPRGTLVAAALGFVVVLLDVSVVNVALAALRQQFATDMAGLQWVVNAYSLAFAALLLTSGALGDRFGARRVFLAGFAVFTVASAACGLADSLPALIVARAVQGVGAAMLVPNSLVLLQQAFPNAGQRSRAVGWWGALGGVALAAGPVVGGLLVSAWGWRSIFLINFPLGLIGAGLTLRYVAPCGGNRRRTLDWSGQGTAIVALATLTLALTEASTLGWRHGRVVLALLAAAGATLSFVWIESHRRSPMLPLALFRMPAFAIACVTGLLVNFAYYGLIFVFSLFFQLQQQLSPLATGLAFLPMTAVLMAFNVLAGRLLPHVGARGLMSAGLALAAVGYLLLLPASPGGGHARLVLPMVLAAGGIALTVPTMISATLAAVEPGRAGLASGVLNTARQIGGLLGVAIFGYLVRDTGAQAFMRGMHEAIASAGAVLALGAGLCWFGMPAARPAT